MDFIFTDIKYWGYSLQPLKFLKTNLITRLVYSTRLNARVAMSFIATIGVPGSKSHHRNRDASTRTFTASITAGHHWFKVLVKYANGMPHLTYKIFTNNTSLSLSLYNLLKKSVKYKMECILSAYYFHIIFSLKMIYFKSLNLKSTFINDFRYNSTWTIIFIYPQSYYWNIE